MDICSSAVHMDRFFAKAPAKWLLSAPPHTGGAVEGVESEQQRVAHSERDYIQHRQLLTYIYPPAQVGKVLAAWGTLRRAARTLQVVHPTLSTLNPNPQTPHP